MCVCVCMSCRLPPSGDPGSTVNLWPKPTALRRLLVAIKRAPKPNGRSVGPRAQPGNPKPVL